MANSLKSLIKMYKHELDEKRQKLAKLYDVLDVLKDEQTNIENKFDIEKKILSESGDISFTFADYVEVIRRKLFDNAKKQENMEEAIEEAKDSMMDTFSELKKYEQTQKSREEREAEELKKKESLELDEIGIDGFRRKKEGEA